MDGRCAAKDEPLQDRIIYFGNQVQLNKCAVNSITINGDLILRSAEIRYLGARLDSNLNFKTHITKKCSAAMANLQRIKSIIHLLDVPMTVSLCVSLCLSHLDYTNAILYRLPDVQNICTK